MTRVIVCCGVGGVGKTTTAAALAVGLARAGERVVVLTIDPARRLADALGLARLDNTPHEVPLAGAGTLHALMLDRKATWDEVVRRTSPDPDTAAKLIENRYYRAVSTRLTGSHEYMATEKLYDLVEAGRWDTVVVDTPPTQHAIEFFRAPDRVRRLFDSGVLTTLVSPGRGLLSSATRRLAAVVGRLAGDKVMEDIGEFFRLFQGLSKGFKERAAAVQALLVSERTRFFLVTSAEAPDRADALGFLDLLRDRGMRFEGFIVNRVSPPSEAVGRIDARALPPRPPDLPPEAWKAWVDALLALPRQADATAERHLAAMTALSNSAQGARVWAVPDQPGGVRTLDGLARLGAWLPPVSPPALG